jgi:hypothetical protein
VASMLVGMHGYMHARRHARLQKAHRSKPNVNPIIIPFVFNSNPPAKPDCLTSSLLLFRPFPLAGLSPRR